ncbi:MAG: hypothetical protein OEZ52_08535 [Candidatus Aminicenantes bacterium]|nr:hypothetical protein [Candidatus Aminicenantes bacterium]
MRKTKNFVVIGLLLLGRFMLALSEEPIIIGKLGEEGELVFPSQAAEGPDGNIYVYDAMDAFIKVYSPEGKFLRKFGGEGQGPGEIQRAGGAWFGFTPSGKLFFTEFFGGHRWITIMELSGKLYETVTIDISEVFGVIEAYPLEDGGFLLELAYSFTPEIRDDYFFYRIPHELVRMDSGGKIISRIKKTDPITRISYRHDGGDAPVPFTPEFDWAPFESNTVLFSDGLSTKWSVYDYEGKLIREIEVPLPEPKKVTKKDLDEWRERWKENVNTDWYNRFGIVVEKYKKSIYERRPNLDAFSMTPDGNVLVAGSAEAGTEHVDYWLLDKEGKILVKGRTDVSGLRITQNFIFYGVRDEEENYQLYVLRRKGTETRDLKKVLKLKVKLAVLNILLFTSTLEESRMS